MNARKPAVAGAFYPSSRQELSDAIRGCYLHPVGPGKLPPGPARDVEVTACVSPHAGYEYSGPVAAHAYLHVSTVRSPDLIVVVGPNHYGVGGGVSTFKEGAWETPLGMLPVDQAAASALVSHSGIVDFNTESHRMEHSVEVQVPFLQSLYGNGVSFLPISMMHQDMETSVSLGRSIAEVVRGKRSIIIASSDLTHYEPYESAKAKDSLLIAPMRNMDLGAFYDTLEQSGITACGFGAIATVMAAAHRLGLRKGELLKYASSGDTGGDRDRVVGYASMRFT